MIYDNDVNVMSPLCSCVALQYIDATEIDWLITKIARHINTICTKIQGNVYMLSSVMRVS